MSNKSSKDSTRDEAADEDSLIRRDSELVDETEMSAVDHLTTEAMTPHVAQAKMK
jgi:hypothetical protein